MKRKLSFSSSTEESFDSLMASSHSQCNVKVSNGIEPISTGAKKNLTKENRIESDKDSDYGGSECDKAEVTTLRMLFEKSHVTDMEFAECCQYIGLLRGEKRVCAKCRGEGELVESRESLDGVVWQCFDCRADVDIRQESWCRHVDVPLKDLVPLIYCWTRGYSDSLASHETDVDPSLVTLVYAKCRSVPSDYFRNPSSNIGGTGDVVFVDVFETDNACIMGGIEVHNQKNLFFKRLPDNCCRDDVVTALVDNIISGSSLVTHDGSVLVDKLSTAGVSYLKHRWNLSLSSQIPPDNLLLEPWNEFNSSIGPSTKSSSTLLDYFLFRRRMDAYKDPFLFFMAVIASVYH